MDFIIDANGLIHNVSECLEDRKHIKLYDKLVSKSASKSWHQNEV